MTFKSDETPDSVPPADDRVIDPPSKEAAAEKTATDAVMVPAYSAASGSDSNHVYSGEGQSPPAVPLVEATISTESTDMIGDETPVTQAERLTSVRDILDEPVTRHLGPAAPLLRVNQTVSAALESVRAAQNVGRVIYFYVVDEEEKLQGVVATRRLLLSVPDTIISEIMSTRILAIPSSATVFEACEFFTLHKLLAFPVIDEDRKILGVVDVDLYTDEILEFDRRQDGEDLFQLVGMHLTPSTTFHPGHAFMGRFPWLLCNVLGGMLAAVIADWYDDVSTLVVVAPFIALVTALSESVSIQAVSLALQVLHHQSPNWKVFLRETRKELLVSMLLGVACGVTVGLVALVWKGSLIVAASLTFGILGGIVASALVGIAMPFGLRLIQRDPQLASGPMALALSDVVTLIFYFSLGRWLLT